LQIHKVLLNDIYYLATYMFFFSYHLFLFSRTTPNNTLYDCMWFCKISYQTFFFTCDEFYYQNVTIIYNWLGARSFYGQINVITLEN